MNILYIKTLGSIYYAQAITLSYANASQSIEHKKELNLTVDQVLEQHPLLTRIKTDIKHLCQKQNVIQLIVPAKNKKKSRS